MTGLTGSFAVALLLVGGFLVLSAFGVGPGRERPWSPPSGCLRWLLLFCGIDALLSGTFLLLVALGRIASPW